MKKQSQIIIKITQQKKLSSSLHKMTNIPAKSPPNSKLQQIVQLSMMNLVSNSKSNTKFIIRYEEKEMIVGARSGHKINRYSSKHQHEVVRAKKISESVLEKNRGKGKDGSLPSYLRPTQASISAQLERNRIASLVQINNETKAGALVKMRSKSLEEEQDRQGEREYNRVPIEFYDEKNYGCGADFLRARVVFRGYAPKNTYYYLKTLKPFKRKPKKVVHLLSQNPSFSEETNLTKPQITTATTPNISKNDLQLRFESKFQSGNLSAASRITNNQYWLYMREDTNTHGLRQWYYFVAVNRKPVKIKFRIYKFTKSYSLYRMGMKPYIRTATLDSNSNIVLNQWQQGGEKIKYEYDTQQKCFYLQFEYKFQEENQQVQFAMLPPYTYSMLKDYLRSLQTLQNPPSSFPTQLQQQQPMLRSPRMPPSPQSPLKLKIHIQSIGQSLAGLDIPSIQIKKILNKNEYQAKSRQAIIILARTHPGETVSNFSLENFIDCVVHSEEIIQHFDFFIVPMVNPDGVYFGNHRTSIIGQDLNRNFHVGDFQVFPEIQAVHNFVNKARRTHKVKFLLDLHGHSARKNIFAYGDQQQINSPLYLHTRILPKLLNDSISSFKYDYSVFRESKQKKNTARVFYTNKFKLNCLTFQQSYGIVDDGPIGIPVWRNFGTALAQSLLQFAEIYKDGKEDALEKYLFQETEKEKVMMEKRMQKHKKMLGIVDEQQFYSMNSTGMNINQNSTEKFKKQGSFSVETQNHANKLEKLQKDTEKQVEQKLENDIIDVNEQTIKNAQDQKTSQKSINFSQLSSGDESLQMNDQQIEVIKKDILKIGCMKQGAKRQKYNIADKKLQLFDYINQNQEREQASFRRLHEQKSSMIPRIVKLQQKRKQDYNLSFKREFREDRRDLLEKQRMERRRQIEAKFKRMELPSIKK